MSRMICKEYKIFITSFPRLAGTMTTRELQMTHDQVLIVPSKRFCETCTRQGALPSKQRNASSSMPPKGLCAVSRSRAHCSLLRSSLASRLGSADSSAPPILPPTRGRAVEMCRQRVFENVGIQQFGLQRSERDLSCLLWAYLAILNTTVHSAESAIWRP